MLPPLHTSRKSARHNFDRYAGVSETRLAKTAVPVCYGLGGTDLSSDLQRLSACSPRWSTQNRRGPVTLTQEHILN